MRRIPIKVAWTWYTENYCRTQNSCPNSCSKSQSVGQTSLHLWPHSKRSWWQPARPYGGHMAPIRFLKALGGLGYLWGPQGLYLVPKNFYFERLLKRPFRGLSQGLQHWLIKGTPRALISSPFWGLERLLKQVVMLDLFDVSCYLDISLCCSLLPLLVCLSVSLFRYIYIY